MTMVDGTVDAPGRSSVPARSGVSVSSSALVIVSALLLGFAFNLLLFSPLRHARDQQVTYASFRSDLAQATAPIGSTDADGQLLTLGAPVAVLSVPEAGISEVVLNGTSSTVLMSGPGHRRDTVLPGQVGHAIVLGRSWAFGGPFNRLGTVRVGSAITVTTGQGIHSYEVMAVRRGDEKPTALQVGEGRLTLVTVEGTAYLPQNLVQVDARLTSDPQPRQGAVLATAFLDPAEAPMAGDSSAAIGLLLWSQLLLVVSVLLVWMSRRWGRWQTWIVAVPVVAALGVAITNHIAMLVPNLL